MDQTFLKNLVLRGESGKNHFQIGEAININIRHEFDTIKYVGSFKSFLCCLIFWESAACTTKPTLLSTNGTPA